MKPSFRSPFLGHHFGAPELEILLVLGQRLAIVCLVTRRCLERFMEKFDLPPKVASRLHLGGTPQIGGVSPKNGW